MSSAIAASTYLPARAHKLAFVRRFSRISRKVRHNQNRVGGIQPHTDFLSSYFEAWEPHTFTDPEAPEPLCELRRRGIKVGVLSNTMWPRTAHEQIFVRDEVFELIDGAVYSSEIDWVKPHPEAFRAAMAALGETDPAACVFVGDRPYDDIHGAKSAGMRAVLIANSDVPRYEAAAPDAIITRLGELIGHIDRWS